MNPTATLEDIYIPIESSLFEIPKTILDILSTPNELAKDVIEYFFSGRGKLLRPALTLLGAEVNRIEHDPKILHLAAAFEIFHGATLIHDDIIDSSYLRRNLPTVNAKWGPQVAVLVGDYLHDQAIQTIFNQGNQKVVSLFLDTARKVCDGEIHELKEKDNFLLKEEDYLEIVDKKTAVLLSCCIQAGAVISGASVQESEALGRFGRWFGIAFQIVDDCLDFMGKEHEFGKTLGVDCAEGVMTLPLIRLIAVTENKKRDEIFHILKSAQADRLSTLRDMLIDVYAIDYALGKAGEYCDKARKELETFPESPTRQSLDKLLDYVLERNK